MLPAVGAGRQKAELRLLARRLFEEPSFGHYYRKGRYYKQLFRAVEPQLAGLVNDMDKARAIYDFLSDNIRWDGTFRLFPEKQPDEAFSLFGKPTLGRPSGRRGKHRKAGLQRAAGQR